MPFNTTPNFKNCVYQGCICCYQSFEIDDMLIGCSGAGEELCIEFDCCCAAPNENNPMKKSGLTPKDKLEEGTFCQISLPCCSQACKKPKVCVSGAGQCLCMKSKASFPFGKHVPGLVCAVCGVQCKPNMGICQPYDAADITTPTANPAGAPAPAESEMTR